MGLPWRSIRLRSRLLLRTSRRVIREQGLWAFAGRLFAWLRGARGYYRTIVPRFPTYTQYIARTEPRWRTLIRQRRRAGQWARRPRFDLITVCAPGEALQHTIRSVRDQTYPDWRWHLVGYPGSIPDARIACLPPDAALRDVLTGDYVITLEAGDQLAPHALFSLAEALRAHPDAAYLYSDVDELDAHGRRCNPFFKPDWSPEILLSTNLLQHLGACRQDLWQALAPGPDSWDFAFRVAEATSSVLHVPQVLYHRQQREPEMDTSAVRAHLQRAGLANPTTMRDAHGAVEVRWDLRHMRRISIIIPSRDRADLLARCLASLFALTSYPAYEVILVDTGSTEAATRDLYAHYAQEPRFRLVYDSAAPFNFSRACNYGAAGASGALLLFLNNDTEILQADWLARMAQWFERPGVGIVGAKLLYPEGKIQHAGVIVGMQGLADNLFALAEEHSQTSYGSDDCYRNFLAVTGACLMISRQAFDQVGGFDEGYQLVFSDVELCLRARAAGYRVVYTPHARLLHHEAATHRRRLPVADLARATTHFREWLRRGDPYYNPNLSYEWPIPNLNRGRRDRPDALNRRSMALYR